MVKAMTRVVMLLLVLALSASASGNSASTSGLFFRVSSEGVLSFRALMRELKDARIVFIGEEHDNEAHHRVQREIIRGMHRSGTKIAIALEMFQQESQPDLDRWASGRMSLAELGEVFARDWNRAYWPYYEELFVFARDRRVPLVGLNIPRKIVREVARKGFLIAQSNNGMALQDVRCDVSQKYKDHIASVLGRDDLDSLEFQNFCEAQVVWDASMARNLLEYATENPAYTVVVLSGALHAWKHGIPEQVRRRSDLPYHIVLPTSDNPFFKHRLFRDDADYIWWQP